MSEPIDAFHIRVGDSVLEDLRARLPIAIPSGGRSPPRTLSSHR